MTPPCTACTLRASCEQVREAIANGHAFWASIAVECALLRHWLWPKPDGDWNEQLTHAISPPQHEQGSLFGGQP